MLPVPVHWDYEFEGWFTRKEGGERVTAETEVWASQTLYAHWHPFSYAVQYELDGGMNRADNPQIHLATEELTLTPAIRRGFAFAGWKYNGQTLTKLPKGISGPVSLVAQWKAMPTGAYQLWLETELGVFREIFVKAGAVCALPKGLSVPKGKRFAGWACSNGRRYDDGMLVFNLAQPGETVTMTAIWE